MSLANIKPKLLRHRERKDVMQARQTPTTAPSAYRSANNQTARGCAARFPCRLGDPEITGFSAVGRRPVVDSSVGARASGRTKGVTMGVMAEDSIEISPDELDGYLRAKTRLFAKVGEETYYVTHTDGYWRVQDCGKLNDKGHFTDCSELVPTVNEVLHLPCIDGKSLYDVAPIAEFFDSI